MNRSFSVEKIVMSKSHFGGKLDGFRALGTLWMFGVRFLGEGERGLELSFHAFYSDCNSVCITPERPDGRLLSHNETVLRYPLLENCPINSIFTSSLIVGGACGVCTI